MAKLPQAADYGARPSLRSNRVDIPGTADLATGEALGRAANTFAQMAGEKKAKQDRLNYSLAKNELLSADIAEREKLKGDEDYETYDERYSTGYNGQRDGIYSKYKLSQSDGQLLDAESNLIRERGRVQVGDAGRIVKRDNEQAAVEGNLLTARESILSESPAIANELMLTQLENIKAAEEAGIYTDGEALGMSQKFVQDTATARLIAMNVNDRIAALEKSLTSRKVSGAISIEDIQAGKGTGSIADFVNRDTAQKMLEASQEAAGIDSRLTDAFSAVDEAFRLHPEPEDGKKRDLVIAELTKGSEDPGRVRKEANIIHRARTTSDAAAENAAKDVEFEAWSDKIYDGTTAYHEIPAEARTYMGAARNKALLGAAESIQHRDGFGEFDDPDTEHKWAVMTPTEKMETNLNTAEWKPVLTHGLWSRMLHEQKAYKDAANKPGKDPNIYRGDPDDEVLRGMLVGGPNAIFDKVPAGGTDDYKRYQYLDSKVNRALVDESLKRYDATGTGYLAPQDVQEITARTIGRVVYIDDWGSNTRTLSTLITSEQESAVYVDIEAVRSEAAPRDSMGNPQNMEQYLRNIAGKEVSERTIERAYYQWISGDAAAANAILME